jgi:hypothetical protein
VTPVTDTRDPGDRTARVVASDWMADNALEQPGRGAAGRCGTVRAGRRLAHHELVPYRNWPTVDLRRESIHR